MAQKIVKQTEELVTPILDEMNLELVDITYEKEGPNWFLRIYIDKEGGVDIEECGQVSEKLSEKLDEVDPVSNAYFLEVSSPGVERPLKKRKDYQEHIGKNIFVKLYEPIDGEKEYTGELTNFQNDTVTITYRIKTRQHQVEIPFQKIAKAHLAVDI
ncbi:hypothetical protein J416_10296 [Gracilibacillus halophilus YIM-C55.5]|uniref:Ribosome maturation factor RimP n=1 Tax=Gracilibacillus halophilus YIM-C55.5 TaxID=1308866 RepID=N4WTW6_9BACI|nr:ribosome maturation factor RimP [Gracilibacillus halophilus]ENH96551.1 hypothetical protein J416_10296 [Gracilibacillus halophilus YIM-C55.5]